MHHIEPTHYVYKTANVLPVSIQIKLSSVIYIQKINNNILLSNTRKVIFTITIQDHHLGFTSSVIILPNLVRDHLLILLLNLTTICRPIPLLCHFILLKTE